jgi:long-chain acyl-CoA synthetase
MMPEAELPPGWPAMSIQQAHALIGQPGLPSEVGEETINGVRLKIWKNQPPTLRAVAEMAKDHGDKVFLVYEDERATYDAFHRAVAAFAIELQAQGVAKGDRVAVIMRNVPEWVVAFYAAASIGAIVTPLNAWWTGPELEYGLTDSGTKVAVMDAERYQRMSEHFANCPELKRVYVSREADEIAHPYVTKLESVLGGTDDWAKLPDQPIPPVDIATDDDATIFYTSGTTGRPKGALATHRAINTNIITAGAAAARGFLRKGEMPPTPDPDAPQRSALLSVPFFHVTGCFAVLNPTVFVGGKLVLMFKWEPIRAFELIQREKVTSAGGVPTIAWQLLEHPARANFDLSSLESVSYGGAPSAPELVRRLKEVFPKSSSGQGWGMTETCATVTSNVAEDYQNRPDSCGPPAAVAELQIRDPADGVTILPAGEMGELWSKGPMNAKLYWNKPEATAQTFVDGWVRTGDLAKLDEDGFCFILDRAKDMLIRGGENIYCVEVENVLYDHPAVMDAAVVGKPHRILGEEPAAVVTLKPGTQATEEELRAHVAERLAAFKVPVAVKFWHETLPRNANGKILKSELKKVFAEEPAA